MEAVAMATNEQDQLGEEFTMRDMLYIDGEPQDINSLYRQNSVGGNCRRKCVVRLDGARYTIGNDWPYMFCDTTNFLVTRWAVVDPEGVRGFTWIPLPAACF